DSSGTVVSAYTSVTSYWPPRLGMAIRKVRPRAASGSVFSWLFSLRCSMPAAKPTSPAGSENTELLAMFASSTVCSSLDVLSELTLNHLAASAVTAPWPNTLNGTQPLRAMDEYGALVCGLIALGSTSTRQTILPVSGSTTASRPACQRSLIRLLRFRREMVVWPKLADTS